MTHGMPGVNMHGSFEAYIRGFTWAVLRSKGGNKLLSMGAARRRRGKGKRERGERRRENEERNREREERKGIEKGRKGKKKREEERGG